MRQILFRGKRIDNEEWVEGFYCPQWFNGKLEDTIYHSRNTSLPNGGHQYTFVIPSTVGQWTGFVDRNGVKIWEGDVAQEVTHYKIGKKKGQEKFRTDPFLVEFSDQTIETFGCCQGEDVELGSGWPYISEVTEIIGNIHDNPHLLQHN